MESDEDHKAPDWRCHTVVRVASTTTVPGLGTLRAGEFGKAVGTVDYQSGHIAFTIPSATSLFLNLSQKHYEEAHTIAQSFSVAPSLETLDDDISFAYFESIMASVIFAYTALESFANEEIPDEFSHPIEKNKCTEVYGKTQIERFLSLGVKLGDILPVVFDLASPKGTKAWEDYSALESLRHSIIHMKQVDREHVSYSSQSVWSRLIDDPVPYSVATAKSMIDYFYDSRSLKPHWYENFPF